MYLKNESTNQKLPVDPFNIYKGHNGLVTVKVHLWKEYIKFVIRLLYFLLDVQQAWKRHIQKIVVQELSYLVQSVSGKLCSGPKKYNTSSKVVQYVNWIPNLELICKCM